MCLPPFRTLEGEQVVIDRGWVAGSQDRRLLPDIPTVNGSVALTGLSWVPLGDAFLLQDDVWSDEWPKVIQAIDLERMNTALEDGFQPWILVLDSDQPGSFQRNFHVTNMSPSRHFGYAIQWFAMAIALVFLGGYAAFKSERPSSKEKEPL